MKKMINAEHFEGYLYQSELEIKTVENKDSQNYGKEYIAGNIHVATDEEGLNVIPIHFTYVTETTSNGKTNRTYGVLKQLMTAPSWIVDGKEKAIKISVDTAFAVNDFYPADGNLVSAKVNEGGFVNIISAFTNTRNKFTFDMVINKVDRVEKDEEKNIPEDYVSIQGLVFNFRNAIMPAEVRIKHPEGMKYFESLDIEPSKPIFTKLWGTVENRTIVVEQKEESAWGEPSINTYERKSREWVVNGTSTEGYDFGDENVLTMDELTKAKQDREVHLAEVKKRSEEYREKQKTTSATSAPINTGDFNF